MCVILVAPHLDELGDVELDKAWGSNSDGAGFAYRLTADKRIVCKKGFMKFRDFEDALYEIPKEHNSLVVHFRVATHGAVKAEFTHPFSAGKNCYLFHNGVMTNFGASGANGYPDSLHIANILARLAPADKMTLLREFAIPNKFVLMNADATWMFGHFQETKANKNVQASNLYWEYSGAVRQRAGKQSCSNTPVQSNFIHSRRTEYGEYGTEYSDFEDEYPIVRERDFYRTHEFVGGVWKLKPLTKSTVEPDKKLGAVLHPGPAGFGRWTATQPKTETQSEAEQEIATKDATSGTGMAPSSSSAAVVETQEKLPLIEMRDEDVAEACGRTPLVLHQEDQAILNGFIASRRTIDGEDL
jgi:predicted glutamine amidotransferase